MKTNQTYLNIAIKEIEADIKAGEIWTPRRVTMAYPCLDSKAQDDIIAILNLFENIPSYKATLEIVKADYPDAVVIPINNGTNLLNPYRVPAVDIYPVKPFVCLYSYIIKYTDEIDYTVITYDPTI